MSKFKAEIYSPNCVMSNIYRKSLTSVIKSAKKAIDNEQVIQRQPENFNKVMINIYEGYEMDTPAFIRKKTTQYLHVMTKSYTELLERDKQT